MASVENISTDGMTAAATQQSKIDWSLVIRRWSSSCWLPVAFNLLLKAVALAAGAVSFNSDEAIVALMARHILQGERPIFFYGQAYMGSLDAWLVAGSFSLFGQTILAIRLVQIALYLGTIV